MSHSQDVDARLQSLTALLGRDCSLFHGPLSRENLGHGSESTEAIASNSQPLKSSPSPSDNNMSVIHRPSLSHLVMGDVAPEHITFCPLGTISTYADNYIGKTNGPLARPFFEDIEQYGDWDFFYLYNPQTPSEPAKLLVPSGQVVLFLQQVNERLDINLSIPRGGHQKKFLLQIGQKNTPRPRFLYRHKASRPLGGFGRCDKEAQACAVSLTKESAISIHDPTMWPDINDGDVALFELAAPQSQQYWLSIWELVSEEMAKGPYYYQPGDGLIERAARRQKKRVEELPEYHALFGLDGTVSDCLFFCVDIEAHEIAPRPVTEIGIAIVHGKDFASQPAGEAGRCWWQFIEAHHLWIKEYSNLINRKHVSGCPDKFDFGNSMLVNKKNIAATVSAILQPHLKERTRMVLVGHALQNDLKWLKEEGVQLPDPVKEIDTQDLFGAWKDFDNGRGLSMILGELGFDHKNLHNGGNDAVWTLRAAIGLTLSTYSDLADLRAGYKAILEPVVENESESK